jgi:hypothetical protein
MSTPTLPREVPEDPGVPPEFRALYVRASFAARIVHTTRHTIHRHWAVYGTLPGIKVGNTLLVSREAMRWWQPGKPGNPNWRKT